MQQWILYTLITGCMTQCTACTQTEKIQDHLYYIKWWNRYIQLATVYHPQGLGHIHYEICPNGYWELHIEGRYEQKWADLAQ